MEESKYKINSLYSFYIIDAKGNYGADGNYFVVTDNEKTYYVPAYNFQIRPQYLLPETIECVVKGFDTNGKPILQQRYCNILKEGYKIGEKYDFKIMSITADKNTGQPFLQLKNSGFYHRMYVADTSKYKINETITLVVKGITEKADFKAFLELSELPDGKPQENESDSSDDKITIEKDEDTEFVGSIIRDGVFYSDMLPEVAKIIVSLLNAKGGTLYIGVSSDGEIVGLESGSDKSENVQEYESLLNDELIGCLPDGADDLLAIEIKKYRGFAYCEVKVSPANVPVYYQDLYLYSRKDGGYYQLRGNEITDYIRNRLQLCENGSDYVDSQKIEQNEKELLNNKNFKGNISRAETVDDSVWYYLNFHTNGDWSYSETEDEFDDVLLTIPILESQRNKMLLICYDNGRINSIRPEKLICNSTKNRYPYGWNMESSIINAFFVEDYDLILCCSKDIYGNRFVKAIKSDYFKERSVFGAKGVIIVNDSINQAKPTFIGRIPLQYKSKFEWLQLFSNQSQQLGKNRKKVSKEIDNLITLIIQNSKEK